MILQRLAEHYDRLQASGEVKLAPPGYSQQKVSFCIVLEPDGRLNSFEDLRQLEGKSLRPRTMVLPGQTKPSGSGLNPCFLWDKAEYLLGWSSEPSKAARAPLEFAASRRNYLAQGETIHQPEYAAVCTFFRNWSPADASRHQDRLVEITSHFGVFRIAGEQCYVHDVVDAPLSSGEQAEAVELAQCLVTGEVAVSARLHEPKIKGVTGAQTYGAPLVSFNPPASESYGRGQGFNAPVSVETVFRYTNALNHLLDNKDRRIGLGDATIVFWADHATPLEDLFADLFTGTAPASDDASKEDLKRVGEAKLLLTQLRDGTRNALLQTDEVDTRFFILGLSPNASRLSVRLWIEAGARELENRLAQHLHDLELKGARDDRPLSVRMLANATGRYDPKGKARFDTTNVSPHLVGELARAVLTGAPYPQSFLATMVRRIRSDAYVGHERVSAIKACLVRNSRLRGAALSHTHQEIPVELAPENTTIAYRCGRLFALLEKAQSDSADGELNSTIKDRYFSSASATPALVFPRLFRLSNHHLAKLTVGQKIFYERQIGSAMAAPFEFPKRFSLMGQGQFIVGYFQQRQDLYKKKEKAPEENA